MILDQLGYPINKGDKVLYTTGAQSNTGLQIGIAEEFNPSVGYAKKPGFKIRTDSGRLASNYRGSYELLSLKYLRPLSEVQQEEPELFI